MYLLDDPTLRCYTFQSIFNQAFPEDKLRNRVFAKIFYERGHVH